MSTEKKHSGSIASENLAPHFVKSRRPAKSVNTSSVNHSTTVTQAATGKLAMSVATHGHANVESSVVEMVSMDVPGMIVSCVDAIADVAKTVKGSKQLLERTDSSHETLVAGPHLSLVSDVESLVGTKNTSTMLVPIADENFRPNKIVPAADSFRASNVSIHAETEILKPKWMVDQFIWPAVTTDLIYQFHELFETTADLLMQSILQGRKRLAITGIVRGEGRTTISMALARKLTNDGKRVLLVDADLVNPQLATAIGLINDISWLTDEAISKAECGEIRELVIGNRVNQTCVMPLSMPNRRSFTRHAFEVLNDCLSQIEPYFDLIILDMGPVSQLDAATLRTIRLARSGMLIHDPELSNVHNFTRAFEKFLSLKFDAFALLQNSARGDFGQVA